MKKVRTGVVGVGHLGYHHARNYADIASAALVGVVDVDAARAAKAAGDFDVPAFSRVSDLIAAGVEAVSVVTPTTGHHGVVLELLEAGVDVLVEKPIAEASGAAIEMVETAARLGCLLQVGHIERFNGAVSALFQAVRAPKFIECHRLSPYPNRGDDVSVVLDLMIHDLDIVLALDGSAVVQVDAVGVPVFSRFEDIANARIRFASGCVANLTCSRVSMERMRKIRVFEANAYVSTNYSEQQVLLYRKKPGPLPDGANPMEAIAIESLPVEHEEPLRRELTAFLTCVQSRERPLVSGEDGLAALRLAERIVQGIRGSA